MMKLLALSLCLLLAFAVPAHAEEAHIVETQSIQQKFCLDVTLELALLDDTIHTIKLQVPAFSVTYRYDTVQSADGRYIGCTVDPDTVVSFSPILPEADGEPNLLHTLLALMDVRLVHEAPPESHTFSGHHGWHTILFTGGSFSVSYNNAIFIDMSTGEVINPTGTTLDLPYTFNRDVE